MITFNFYMKDTAPEKLDRARRSRFEDYKHTDFTHSRDGCVLQHYLALKDRVPGCQVSAQLDPDAVNIVMTYDLPYMPPPNRPFVLSFRCDYTPRFWADMHVVHIKSHLDAHSAFAPNLPQHEIVPRDPARGKTFTTVGYFGRQLNHISRFTRRAAGFQFIAEQVAEICRRLDMQLLVKGEETWNDYSDVDVSIGIRDFSGRRFKSKPAVKLVNSWLAGVPFIGGMDAGYLEVGEPDFSYLRVATAKELEGGLLRLARDPELRTRMVDRGRRLGASFTYEETVWRWETLLKGRVTDLFLARRRAGAPAPLPEREKVTVDA